MKYDGQTDWAIMNSDSVRIVLMLFRSRNQIWDADHKIVHQYGLTWAQFNTLAALRQAPPPHILAPSRLYDAVQVTSGGLTKILSGLEDQGNLVRVANPDDQRSIFAQLTSQGQKLIEKLAGELSRVNGRIFDDTLSQTEQKQLAVLLEKLCKRLDQPAVG